MECALRPCRPRSSAWRRFTSRVQRSPASEPSHIDSVQTVQKRSEKEINETCRLAPPALFSSRNCFQRKPKLMNRTCLILIAVNLFRNQRLSSAKLMLAGERRLEPKSNKAMHDIIERSCLRPSALQFLSNRRGRNHIGNRPSVWDTTLTATAISRKASAVPTKLPATGTA
jgi:hypothetical protein